MEDARKKDLFRGVVLMLASLPMIFAGPALMFGLGIPRMREGNWDAILASFVIMLFAGVVAVKGLKTILTALFSNNE